MADRTLQGPLVVRRTQDGVKLITRGYPSVALTLFSLVVAVVLAIGAWYVPRQSGAALPWYWQHAYIAPLLLWALMTAADAFRCRIASRTPELTATRDRLTGRDNDPYLYRSEVVELCVVHAERPLGLFEPGEHEGSTTQKTHHWCAVIDSGEETRVVALCRVSKVLVGGPLLERFAVDAGFTVGAPVRISAKELTPRSKTPDILELASAVVSDRIERVH